MHAKEAKVDLQDVTIGRHLAHGLVLLSLSVRLRVWVVLFSFFWRRRVLSVVLRPLAASGGRVGQVVLQHLSALRSPACTAHETETRSELKAKDMLTNRHTIKPAISYPYSVTRFGSSSSQRYGLPVQPHKAYSFQPGVLQCITLSDPMSRKLRATNLGMLFRLACTYLPSSITIPWFCT
jgi:hypothetical protein